jgi:hypothetical protein
MQDEDVDDTPGNEKRRSDAEDAAAKMAGAGLAATAGFFVAGPVGSIVAAVLTDPAIRMTNLIIEEIRGVRYAAAATLVQQAADRLGVEPQDVVSSAFTDPERAAMLSESLEAAIRTMSAQKIAALAHALAAGLLRDEARVDDERLIIRALTDLEEPHIRALFRFTGVPPRAGLRRSRMTLWTGDDQFSNASAEALINTLERNGLIARDTSKHDAELRRYSAAKLNNSMRKANPKLSGRYLDETAPRPEVEWRTTSFGVDCAEYLLGTSEQGG